MNNCSINIPSDICPINFYIRSNAGINVGNRDAVNQLELKPKRYPRLSKKLNKNEDDFQQI